MKLAVLGKPGLYLASFHLCSCPGVSAMAEVHVLFPDAELGTELKS